MRVIAFIAVALALSACGQAGRDADSGDCNVSVTRTLAWPEGDARLTVTASAEGESCAHATATLTLQREDGANLHSFSAAYHALVIGGEAPADAAAAPRADVEAFLNIWADARPIRASALPAWREGAAHPGDESALPYRSPLARAAYEAYRAAAAPALCLAISVDAVECLVIDAQTGVQPVLGYAE